MTKQESFKVLYYQMGSVLVFFLSIYHDDRLDTASTQDKKTSPDSPVLDILNDGDFVSY